MFLDRTSWLFKGCILKEQSWLYNVIINTSLEILFVIVNFKLYYFKVETDRIVSSYKQKEAEILACKTKNKTKNKKKTKFLT